MTPKKIMEAYKAVNELANCIFPYAVTRQICLLKKRLTEEFYIVLKSEKDMVHKYGGEFSEDRTYKFSSHDDAAQFYREYQNFLDQEIYIDLPKVDVSKCQSTLVISAASIAALEGVVTFEED